MCPAAIGERASPPRSDFGVLIRVIPNVPVIRLGDTHGMDRRTPRAIKASPPGDPVLADRGRAAAGRTSYERLALAGAIWSALFALAHFYWASGGRLGTTDNLVPISHRPLFLAYDLAAGLVLLSAAAVATVLTSGLLKARLWSGLLTVTVWGAVIALVRGASGLAQDTIAAALGRGTDVGVIYDIWFAVAGAVFIFAARGLRRQGPPANDRRSARTGGEPATGL